MEIHDYALLFGLTLLVLALVDGLWIGVISKGLYQTHLKTHLRKNPNWSAIAAFYFIFATGLVYFVLREALAEGNLPRAAINGGVFGLCTYSAYQLTNLAIVKKWPRSLVYIDISWGIVASVATSIVSYLLFNILQS